MHKKRQRGMLSRGLGRTLIAMDHVGLLDALAQGRRLLPRRAVVVLNYHRILDATPLDEGVISATAEEFDEQARLIAQTSTCLSVGQLIQVLDGEMAMPDNAVMLTFDDGYLDNYEVALPSLLRYGIRATFFVTTGFIETGCLPWWDRISYVLKQTAVRRIHVEYPVRLSLGLGTVLERHRARRTLFRVIKQACGLDLQRFLAEVEQAAAVPVDAAALTRGLFMRWDQVRELHAAGMDIGAHTHEHLVLQTLDERQARQELQLPQHILRERLGFSPRAIAYPVGFPVSATSHLRSLLQESGYEVGFTFMPGVIAPPPYGPPMDRFNLPRLAVDRSVGAAAARFKVALLAPTSLT